MTLQDLVEALGSVHCTAPCCQKELDYTVIVVDEESNEFRGVKAVRFNHDDRNVTIETH